MRKKILKLEGTQTRVSKVLLTNTPSFKKTKDNTENLSMINLDLPRQPFIDAKASFEDMCKRWKAAAKQQNYSYSQGDMTGGSTTVLVWSIWNIRLCEKKRKNMEPGVRREDIALELHFGYVDDNNKESSFSLLCSKKNPEHWMASILQNASAPHDQQHGIIYNRNFELAFELEEEIATSFDSSTDLTDLFASLKSVAIADFLSHVFLPNEKINLKFSRFCAKTAGPAKCIKPIELLFTYPGHSSKKLLEKYVEKKCALQANTPRIMSDEESKILDLKFEVYREIIDRAQETVTPIALIKKTPDHNIYVSLSTWISNLADNKIEHSESLTLQCSDMSEQELLENFSTSSKTYGYINSETIGNETSTHTSSETREEESSSYSSSEMTEEESFDNPLLENFLESESSEDDSSNTPTP